MRHPNLVAWYFTGSRQQRTTFWACFSGWTLDTFDAQLFSFLLPALIATWGISKGEAGMLGTAALLSSALGGWVAGILRGHPETNESDSMRLSRSRISVA